MLYPGRFILVESVFLRVRSFWKRRKIKFPMLQKMLANNRCLLFFIFSRIELCIKLKNSWVAKWFVRFFFMVYCVIGNDDDDGIFTSDFPRNFYMVYCWMYLRPCSGCSNRNIGWVYFGSWHSQLDKIVFKVS